MASKRSHLYNINPLLNKWCVSDASWADSVVQCCAVFHHGIVCVCREEDNYARLMQRKVQGAKSAGEEDW